MRLTSFTTEIVVNIDTPPQSGTGGPFYSSIPLQLTKINHIFSLFTITSKIMSVRETKRERDEKI